MFQQNIEHCPLRYILLFLHIVTPFTAASENSSEPFSACAVIAEAFAAWDMKGGQFLPRYLGPRTITDIVKGDGDFRGIPGQVGYDCLRSMPFFPRHAEQFIDEYLAYLQLHSTLDILQDPPSEYSSPAIDLVGELTQIRRKAGQGFYENQFDFDQSIQKTVVRGYDGHLRIDLCSQNIIVFEHNEPLVSVSEDGLQLPEIYTWSDAQLKNAGNCTVSPVLKINGLDATDYLEAHAALGIDAHDPDVRYNRLFPDPVAAISQQWPLGDWVRNKGLWPGAANFLLHFANGSDKSIEVTATWPRESGKMNHTNGDSLYKAFCDATLPSNAMHDFPTVPPKYRRPTKQPLPIIGHHDNLMFGYYLDGPGLNDVAVLQVPTFQSSKLEGNATSISETAAIFVQRAIADQRTRMIVDVSSNGGGDLIEGFRLASVFFPHKPIYTATRFRATELIDLMGRVYNNAVKINASSELGLDTSLVAQWTVTPDQESDFESWGDLYGPHQVMNSKMSTLHASFNFSQSLAENEFMKARQFGLELAGEAGGLAPKNIIIISNGFCASTCAIFVEEMRLHGVRTMVFGGRPHFRQMQAVGGTKGGERWSLDKAYRYIIHAFNIAQNANDNNTSILSRKEFTRFKSLLPPDPRFFSIRFNRQNRGGLNFRSAFRIHMDGVPLQFFNDYADCRLFYTIENYLHLPSSWRAAASYGFSESLSCIQNPKTEPASVSNTFSGASRYWEGLCHWFWDWSLAR